MLEISLYYFNPPLNPLPINRVKWRGLLPRENVDYFHPYRTSLDSLGGWGQLKMSFFNIN
jgi:hypothetical protein